MDEVPSASLWLDIGPASQGKIITAVLLGRDGEVKRLLRQWSYDDLTALDRASERLSLMIRQEKARRG